MSQNLLSRAIQQQQLAANPLACAWVSASAGTGKTKVLIDRLLALLLHGVSPEHILCLTFTKAAASEMQQRLFDALQCWVLQDEETLSQTLTVLLTKSPTASQILRARQLYTLALEAIGGLKISTIHGFCQTLLTRFPLEAGITPNPTLLDDKQGEELLNQAKYQVLACNLSQGTHGFTRLMVTHFKDASLQDVLQEVLTNRRYFYKILEKYPSLSVYAADLCAKLSLNLGEGALGVNLLDIDLPVTYFSRAYQLSPIDQEQLLTIATESENPILTEWLASDATARWELFGAYRSLYLTQKGELLKKPKVDFAAEAQQVYRLNKILEMLELAQKSACVFQLASDIVREYQRLKQQQNLLDYDDLIEKTIHLLTQPDISPWILHKLDGGIQHLLVDEAQDTNPDQWRVILALTESFLSPDSGHRTFFVVGDVKQSIYSFQGASPHDFIQLRKRYRDKCQVIGQPWYDIDLTVSFRSTPEILQTVDKIVNQSEHQIAIQFHDEETKHLAFRGNHQGGVYLLPAILIDRQVEKLSPWPIPDQPRRMETPLDQVCHQVNLKIQQLLGEKMVLPSTGQPIQPKDILVLVKQRGDLAPQLIRCLKKQAVPVAGIDRFLLNSHLAVQDLIALGQFLLLPQDDLALACVLKGSFLDLTEEDLLQLAATRHHSLWHELSQRSLESVPYRHAFNFLKSLLREVDYMTPYQLYHSVLFKREGLQKIRSRFGLEADDAIMEFLNHAFKASENRPTTLQQFLGEVQQESQEIKRDSADSTQNQVRVMTIHGAKGLQAPVVFIVEKFKSRAKIDRLLWELDDAREGQFMLMRPSSEADTPYTSYLKAKVEQQENNEDKRLFYVALTRAQDYLYLAGYGDREIPEDSWYQWLRAEGVQTTEMSEDIPRYQMTNQNQIKTENWLLNPVKHRKITPTIAKDEMPEQTEQTTAMQRGVLIHRLFELLFDLPESAREKAAKSYLEKYHSHYIDVSLAAILEVLSSEMLRPFTQGRAISEMEMMTKDGRMIRLDRVVVTENVIKILDFKTSEQVPHTVLATPKVILTQLADYAAALATVYPAHYVECYLLWTAEPVLHSIPEFLLKGKSSLSYQG